MSAINAQLASGGNRESWIPLLELAAQEVLAFMLGGHLDAAPAAFDEAGLDITAIVGLAGQVSGAIALRCPSESAILMAAKMLGVDAKQAGPEMRDAVGEVCNMIAGNFKNKIPGMGDGCMLSVPTVITGRDYRMHAVVDSAKIETHLLFEGLPLIVSIEVHS
jgi:chemotaxis protein CheX